MQESNAISPAPPAGHATTVPQSASPMPPGTAAAVMHRRDLYWQNVMREILTGLAAAAAMSAGRLSATASGAAGGGSPASDLFDGRLAIITTLGQRIPIADIVPMFACSVVGGDDGRAGPRPNEDRLLSTEVQCTVYQIRTPGGEVHTLPVQHIASFHALSEQLIRKLQITAARAGGNLAAGEPARPFGFAAFTSLAQSESERSVDDERLDAPSSNGS